MFCKKGDQRKRQQHIIVMSLQKRDILRIHNSNQRKTQRKMFKDIHNPKSRRQHQQLLMNLKKRRHNKLKTLLQRRSLLEEAN